MIITPVSDQGTNKSASAQLLELQICFVKHAAVLILTSSHTKSVSALRASAPPPKKICGTLQGRFVQNYFHFFLKC